MVTSGVSYAVHYELGGRTHQDGLLQDFSRLRIDTMREQPVLYVAMATWIPKCNMYHQQNNSEPEVVNKQNEEEQIIDVQLKNGDSPTTKSSKSLNKGSEEKLDNSNKKETPVAKKMKKTPQKSPKHVQKKLKVSDGPSEEKSGKGNINIKSFFKNMEVTPKKSPRKKLDDNDGKIEEKSEKIEKITPKKSPKKKLDDNDENGEGKSKKIEKITPKKSPRKKLDDNDEKGEEKSEKIEEITPKESPEKKLEGSDEKGGKKSSTNDTGNKNIKLFLKNMEVTPKKIPKKKPDDNGEKSEEKLETDDTDNSEPVSSKSEITPKKCLSPRQIQKRLESEKKRQQKQQERDEKRQKENEEKERLRQEKIKQKQELKQKVMEEKQKLLDEKQKQLEQKQKEKEMKEEQRRKEKEEKEQKRKEKEERAEQQRKEKELKKQQEIDEKNKEKLKLEEQKKKTAKVFANFFVEKKRDNAEEKKLEENQCSNFMPFEVKSEMRLPLNRRPPLTDEEKQTLTDYFDKQKENESYLKDLKLGKIVGKCGKTWPYEDISDEVVLIGDDLGETICEDKPKTQILRAKYLKFHTNRRPAYFGTWRKKSNFVAPRRPFAEDKTTFDYEVDSDDDWEEEEQGESLNGSDDEEKEPEVENDDYEVDNEFFVPHGHLSDDEVDDEETARLSPESLKQKLKLLKDEFDQDMQLKTHKLKPRSIGCIWYNKAGNNVDKAIDRYLQPLAIITNGKVIINKRSDVFNLGASGRKKVVKELNPDYVPEFLKCVHGNFKNKRELLDQFITFMANKGFNLDMNKFSLGKNLKQMASWKKCTEDGPMKNKHCWIVNENVKEKYNVDLVLPNTWESD